MMPNLPDIQLNMGKISVYIGLLKILKSNVNVCCGAESGRVGRKSEVSKQKSEAGGQKSEVRSRRSEGKM